MGRYKKHFRKGTGSGNKVVSDEVLIKLSLEGKLRSEIAREVGLTFMAVDKRLKRLDNEIKKARIIKESGITVEEGEFCKKLVSGHGYGPAMVAANPNLSPISARSIGEKLFKERSDIKAVIRELMELKGIGLSRRIERLGEHVEAKDPGISLKALDMSFKLDGSLISEVHTQTTVNVGIMDLSAYAIKPVEVKEV